MKTNKTYGSGIQTTINPSKIGAGLTSLYDSRYRPLQWIGDPLDERMQNVQNIHSLTTLMDTLPPPTQYTLTNPAAHWTVENDLKLFTYINKAMSASDTNISVAEPNLCKIGWRLILPGTNQILFVTTVNEDLSEGWVNGAGDACNVKVNRTKLSAHSIAATINSEVRPALPVLGEIGIPKEGISEVPGDPRYNFAVMSALYVKMSTLQRNMLMADDYGTHKKLVKDNEKMLAVMAQASMLGDVRKAVNDDDEGMIYQGNGIVAQIDSNVLNLGNVGNNATFQVMSEFWDGTFESANSSASKVHVAGAKHYMNLLNTARQEGAIVQGEETHYNPAIGVNEFSIDTGGGNRVMIQRHPHAMNGSYSDCGLTLDLGQMARGELAGFEGWKWSFDLDDNSLQGLTLNTSAIVGSQMIALLDPDCFAFARGGTIPVLKSRNDVNGIVTDISKL